MTDEGITCSNCGGKSTMFLCNRCADDLHDMLTGLAVGQPLPDGHDTYGWLSYLADHATGDTRLGLSVRRSTDTSSPLPYHEGASGLFREVHDLLSKWTRMVLARKGNRDQ